ncbi:hypothetical protein ACJ41O_001448 [Fusarium nematophilum]
MIRDFEQDIIPMARHYGMALFRWDVLRGGSPQAQKQLEARKQANDGGRGSTSQSDEGRKVSAALEKVAAEHGIESMQQITLAYVL